MGSNAINKHTPIGSAQSATSITLEVSNGDVVDGSGNAVVIGGAKQGPDYFFSDDDEPVDRVKGATPTGNLRVDTGGNLYVNGYGNVTLTNGWNGREVSNVGGYDGEDGDLKVDSGGSIYSEYTTTTTDSASNENTSTASGDTSATKTNSNSGSFNASYPTFPSDSLFGTHPASVDVSISNTDSTSNDYTVTVDWGNGTSSSKTKTINDGASASFSFSNTLFSNYVGNTVSYTISGGNYTSNNADVVAKTTYTDPDANPFSASASYPSVPSGYNFDHHSIDASVTNNGGDGVDITADFDTGLGTVDTQTTYVGGGNTDGEWNGPNESSKSVGTNASVTAQNTNFNNFDVTAEAETHGTKTVTQTNTTSVTIY